MPPARFVFNGEMFSNDRFGVLAHVLELPGGAEQAVVRYLRLLEVCALTQHYTVSPMRVEVVFGRGGVDALVRAELAELVPMHQPTRWAEELGLRPTPAADGEWVVRLEYVTGAIEIYGRQIKAASAGGLARAKKYAQAAVDKPEENLSETCERASTSVHRRVPTGTPTGMPAGNPTGMPSDAHASEKRSRSSDLQTEEAPDRKPARGATPGLRVIAGGGAEGTGES